MTLNDNYVFQDNIQNCLSLYFFHKFHIRAQQEYFVILMSAEITVFTNAVQKGKQILKHDYKFTDMLKQKSKF